MRRAIVVFLLLLVIPCQAADPDESAGELAAKKKDWPGAIAAYERALDRCTASHDSEGRKRVFGALQDVLEAAARWPQHVAHARRELSAARADRDVDGEIDALESLVNGLTNLRQYDAALECCKLARALDDKRGGQDRADILLAMGGVYSCAERHAEAIPFVEQALALARKDDDRDNMSAALNLLGRSYGALGRYDRAIAALQELLEMRKAAGNRQQEGGTQNNLGLAWAEVRDYERAAACFAAALTIATETGYRELEATALQNQAVVSCKLNRFDEAVRLEERAKAVFQALGDRAGEAAVLNNMAIALTNLRKLERALQCSEASVRLTRTLNLPASHAQHLFNLGCIQFLVGQRQRAMQTLTQSVAAIRANGVRGDEAQALTRLSEIYAQMGRVPQAIYFGKLGINAYEDVRGHVRNLDRAAQQSFTKSIDESYRDLVSLLIGAGRIPEAQEVLSLLKEDEYQKYTRGAAASGTLTLTAEERALQARYASISDSLVALSQEREKLLADPDRAKVMSRLLAVEKDMKVSRQNLELFLQQVGLELKGGGRLSELKNLSSVQEELRALGAGTVLIYTVAAPEGFREILVTADLAKTYALPVPAKELNRLVLDFRQALRDTRSDPRAAGKRLYDVMLSPALEADLAALHARHVMWSLDGTLRYVPVNALWDGKRWLVEKYLNSIFTPASQGSLARAPIPDWHVAALGVSKAWQKFPPLPGVPDELKSIVKTRENPAGALPGTVQLDPAFDETALQGAILGRNAVIHIASHFNFAPGDDRASFLLLGNGKSLTVADLKGYDFEGVDLLTLSACNTAIGGVGEGSEIESFAMLAQRHKARAVLATLWPVADDSTPLLMAAFYKIRAEHPEKSKIEALQQAQIMLLNGTDSASSKAQRGAAVIGASPQKGRFSHPFYWAPFILIGNYR